MLVKFATLLLFCTPVLVLADNWCCDESTPCMSADIEGGRKSGYPFYSFNTQVMNIKWGRDWIKGCVACGEFLENRSDICPGWYCQQNGAGVWLQRNAYTPECTGIHNLKTNNTRKIIANKTKTYLKKK